MSISTKWLKVERNFIRVAVIMALALTTFVYNKVIEQMHGVGVMDMLAYVSVVAFLIWLMVAFEKVTKEQMKMVKEKEEDR